jgi:hypothetical protein
LEYVSKAEVLLHDISNWLTDEDYPYDNCPTVSWIPSPDIKEADITEAQSLLMKGAASADKSETNSNAVKVRQVNKAMRCMDRIY